MRRLKKSLFQGISLTLVGVLYGVQLYNPHLRRPHTSHNQLRVDTLVEDTLQVAPEPLRYHPLRGVVSYKNSFPDLQETQIIAAKKWGITPLANRADALAEVQKERLVYIGASPYVDIDNRMHQSIPYLVPRASILLQRIGRSFMDSLCVKGYPLHRIVVSSVLRTDDDVKKLRRYNVNASQESCHRYGTTFDITYRRYNPICPNQEPPIIHEAILKHVLAEVLRDFRKNGQCYVKHEVKQACFHITVR